MPLHPDPVLAVDVATRPRRHLSLISSPLPPTGRDDALDPARADHPAGQGLPMPRPRIRLLQGLVDEGGSLVAEYGLLLVLGATITMLATKWATGGAIWTLFGAVLSRARALVGA